MGSDAIIWASDGPVLILADGSAVRPKLHNSDGDPMSAWSINPSGGAIYGPEVDADHTRLNFEPDPDATEIQAVKEAMEGDE